MPRFALRPLPSEPAAITSVAPLRRTMLLDCGVAGTAPNLASAYPPVSSAYSVPPLITVPPVNVLVADSVSVPAPFLTSVRAPVLLAMGAEIVMPVVAEPGVT